MADQVCECGIPWVTQTEEFFKMQDQFDARNELTLKALAKVSAELKRVTAERRVLEPILRKLVYYKAELVKLESLRNGEGKA